jgi:hypothetical protein
MSRARSIVHCIHGETQHDDTHSLAGKLEDLSQQNNISCISMSVDIFTTYVFRQNVMTQIT